MQGAKHPSTDLRRPMLTWLVGDIELFHEAWGRTPFVRHAEPGFECLASIASIETWLARSARRPMFRMVQDGKTLPFADITRTARLGGQNVTDLADVERIAQRFANGATLVVQNFERALPRVHDLVTGLAAELSHPVQANGYLSPPGATGLASHTDTHDVLVLQVSGSKHWDVEGLGSVTTVPGDVVYIPSGTRHAARTSEHTSLHLTIGILRVTTRQVVRRVLESLDGELDEPLPVGFATGSVEALAADVGRRLEGVIESLKSFDPRHAAEAEIGRSRTRQSASGGGALSAVAGELALDQRTVVRPRPSAVEVALDVDDDKVGKVYVKLADRAIGFPRSAEPALRRLLSGTECTVDELPGLDATSRIVVVRRLVREGVLECCGGAPEAPGAR